MKRRAFLQVSGVGAAGLVFPVAGCASHTPDVVVGTDGSQSYFDSEGTRFDLDAPQHQIAVRASSGKVYAMIGGLGEDAASLNGPAAMVVGAERTIYVADRGNRRVQVFDYRGRHLQTIGGRGTNLFGLPGGIAIDANGRLLVTDTLRRRVAIFDASGRPVGDFGGPSSALEAPRGLAIASDGNIHVADPGSSGIHAFDSNGRFLFTHLAPTAQDAPFRPHGLAIAPDGSVYVADATYSGLYISRTDGTFVARKSLTVRNGFRVAPGAASHVSLMPGGDVYVATMAAGDWQTAA